MPRLTSARAMRDNKNPFYFIIPLTTSNSTEYYNGRMRAVHSSPFIITAHRFLMNPCMHDSDDIIDGAIGMLA